MPTYTVYYYDTSEPDEVTNPGLKYRSNRGAETSNYVRRKNLMLRDVDELHVDVQQESEFVDVFIDDIGRLEHFVGPETDPTFVRGSRVEVTVQDDMMRVRVAPGGPDPLWIFVSPPGAPPKLLKIKVIGALAPNTARR